MFIDSTIFKGELQIVSFGDNCEPNENLDWFIEKYEPEILRCLLGQTYYELLDAVIVQGDKFDILLNGGTYEVGDYTYSWVGLKYIVACYIYFLYQREYEVITTSNGGKVVEYEKAKFVSLRGKAIRNWNNATRQVKGGCKCTNNFCNATLEHYLINNDFDNVCVSFYEGGLIADY